MIPRLPSLLGLDEVTENWWAGLQKDAESVAPDAAEYEALLNRMSGLGLSAAEVDYLQSISSTPGKPLFMVSPDWLPAGWVD